MVIDSSALVAILALESEEAAFRRAILRARERLIGTATLLETSMVMLGRQGEPAVKELEAYIRNAQIDVVPFEPHHAALALDAFRRFGKGRHQAGLNYGDCMAYALAMATDLPLLFKGDDFIHTDVRAAV